MKKIILTSIIIAATLITACGSSEQAALPSQTTKTSSPSVSSENKAPASSQYSASQNNGAPLNLRKDVGGAGLEAQIPIPQDNISITQASASQSEAISINRKVIRNGDLQLECEQPDEAQQRIMNIVQSNGGFVVESKLNMSDVKINTRDVVEMTVRVPADKFAETIDQIKNASGRILQETVKGEDVTEEFIDIDARLTAKKALEQQIMQIMKQTNNLAEALNFHRQLADVRAEIEKIEGRKRFLDNQASLSTIKIRLQTPAVFTANTSGFFYRLSESFGEGLETALNFILGMVTVLVAVFPQVVLIGLPGYFIVRAVLRRRIRPMSVTEIAKEELNTD